LLPKSSAMKIKHFAIVSGLAAAVALAGCGKSSNVTTQSAATSAADAGTSVGGGALLAKSGERFQGQLQQEISTKKSHDGDTFTIVQHDTFMHSGDPALKGAVIDGHLENVSAAGVGRKPALTLVFDDVKLPNGETAPIHVQLINVGAFDARSHHWRTLGMVVAAGAAGHMAAGAHHGGMAAAAGAYLLSQQMKTDVDVKPGTSIELRFLNDAVANAGSPAATSSP
jgi:hypothetical protein